MFKLTGSGTACVYAGVYCVCCVCYVVLCVCDNVDVRCLFVECSYIKTLQLAFEYCCNSKSIFSVSLSRSLIIGSWSVMSPCIVPVRWGRCEHCWRISLSRTHPLSISSHLVSLLTFCNHVVQIMNLDFVFKTLDQCFVEHRTIFIGKCTETIVTVEKKKVIFCQM